MQFGLRKLFLLTTVVAAAAAVLHFLFPLGFKALITFILAPTPFVFMLHGWRLQAKGDEDRGTNYVAIGLLLAIVIGPVLVMALLSLTWNVPDL